MKRLPLILPMLLIASCSPKLYPTQTIAGEKTIVEKEIIRDTIIQIQPDSTIMEALIQCDSTGRARLQEIKALKESQRIQQTIRMSDTPQPYQPTSVTIKAKIDSMGIYLTYKERFKEETKTEIREIIVEKEVNILHWWQRALIWLGIVSLVYITTRIAAYSIKH